MWLKVQPIIYKWQSQGYNPSIGMSEALRTISKDGSSAT